MNNREHLWTITKYSKVLPRESALQDLFKDFSPAISTKLQKSAQEILDETYNFIKNFKFIKQRDILSLVNNMIDELLVKDNKILNLIDIENFKDYYHFSHPMNVCILSLSLGIKLGLLRDDLINLGLGALLHDIGFLFVNEDILEKPHRLSKVELLEIKKHPALAYEVMYGSRLPQISCRIVYEHHERTGGNGYPNALDEGRVHPFAFIVAVADVYDALTSERPYRQRLSKPFAMKLLLSHVADNLPPETIELLHTVVGSYPIGSVVKLNTNEIAIVIKQNTDSLHRPIVRVFINEEGEYLKETKEINLKDIKYKFIISTY